MNSQLQSTLLNARVHSEETPEKAWNKETAKRATVVQGNMNDEEKHGT